MPSPRLNVVVTRRLPDAVESRMKELFNATLRRPDIQMERRELRDAMGQADVLVANLGDHIDAELIADAGSQLKLIANYGVGVDHINVAAAESRGIAVTNTPGVMTEDTADMVMALIMAVTRRIPEGLMVMQAGGWQGWSPTSFLGSRITGKKLGILGLGRIGQAVARRAKAFGLEVHYHNRHRVAPEIEQELGATWWESLDQMLTRVDILSINCPHTPSTFHLLNERRLKLMKPTAVVVNTSRGEVIDENALTRALRSKEIAGAGLDVFEHGHDINPRLRAQPNVVLLPHMGSATFEGRVEMGEKVIANILAFAEGKIPPDLVLSSML